MSYDHKDLVQSGTKDILSEGFEEVSPGMWKRREVKKVEPLIPKQKKTFWQKLLSKLTFSK